MAAGAEAPLSVPCTSYCEADSNQLSFLPVALCRGFCRPSFPHRTCLPPSKFDETCDPALQDPSGTVCTAQVSRSDKNVRVIITVGSHGVSQ